MVTDTLAKIVLSATRNGFLRPRPIFEPYARVSPDKLLAVEERIGVPIPGDLREWLLTVGYGDLNEELSFREEWFAPIESGQLTGGGRFAQDILGNFYAFDASQGGIYYLSRAAPVSAPMSNRFMEFMEQLVRREYKLIDWVNTLATQKYEW